MSGRKLSYTFSMLLPELPPSILVADFAVKTFFNLLLLALAVGEFLPLEYLPLLFFYFYSSALRSTLASQFNFLSVSIAFNS